jgi:hypothetical protein
MTECGFVVSSDSWWDSLVRDRFQAVLELVLDAMSDDYVTIDIILQTINEWDSGTRPETWEARSAVPVTRPEVVRALKELTREGYAQAYLFNGPEANPVPFHPASIRDLWFFPTDRGMNAISRFPGKD